jgi:hypothetical protein
MGSSLFVLLGLWGMTSDKMPLLISWLCVGFFSLGIIVGLFHLFDRRPQIIINETGIFDRMTHNVMINWELIESAYPMNISGQKFICLVLREQFTSPLKKGKLSRATAKLNQAIGAQELNLSLGQIDIDADKLTEFILLMRNAVPHERQTQVVKALEEWK